MKSERECPPDEREMMIAEAEAAYDETVPVPMSKKEIRRIMKRVVRRDKQPQEKRIRREVIPDGPNISWGFTKGEKVRFKDGGLEAMVMEDAVQANGFGYHINVKPLHQKEQIVCYDQLELVEPRKIKPPPAYVRQPKQPKQKKAKPTATQARPRSVVFVKGDKVWTIIGKRQEHPSVEIVTKQLELLGFSVVVRKL